MRVFDQSKTVELTEYDRSAGRLVRDTLFVASHPAVEGRAEVWHYEYTEYENGGRDRLRVVDEPAVEAHDAWDEVEDIFVYIPYTAEELETRRRDVLRKRRAPLLTAFDKWEKAVLRGRETEDDAVTAWFLRLLDLDESALAEVPARVRYYL